MKSEEDDTLIDVGDLIEFVQSQGGVAKLRSDAQVATEQFHQVLNEHLEESGGEIFYWQPESG